MTSKPQQSSEYTPDQTKAAISACQILALRLGDLLDDLVIVGGLVPTLLVRGGHLEADGDVHAGTADLDVGISISLLEGGRYHEIASALKAHGMQPAVNSEGRRTSQRWESGFGISIDFLIAPTRADQRGGRLQNLEPEFAAIVTPGLDLAFLDREQVEIDEDIPGSGRIVRSVGVCGPAAFVLLKALAFAGRGEPKDAYDLYYVLRHYGESIGDLAERMKPLLNHPASREALAVLQRDFSGVDHVGVTSALRFSGREGDDGLAADISGDVQKLLQTLGAG